MNIHLRTGCCSLDWSASIYHALLIQSQQFTEDRNEKMFTPPPANKHTLLDNLEVFNNQKDGRIILSYSNSRFLEDLSVK